MPTTARPVSDPAVAPTARSDALQAGSRSLAAFVARDEHAAAIVADPGPLPGPRQLRAILGEASAAGGMGALRLERRRRLAAIAARDLAGELSLPETMAALSALADATLLVALGELDPEGRLGIVALGKLGATELNYCSDIDITFVCDEDPVASTGRARALLQELGGPSPEGQAYRIDTTLRPEGRNGPLVRSLDACLEYYRRWAQPWEHQALIKARAVTAGAAQRLVDETRAVVFSEEVDPERIAAVRAMKQRVEEHAVRAARRARDRQRDDVKLGPGGIRDIEFTVQLLQLVHGGTDATVREPGTLSALRALIAGGYVADEDGAGLAVDYTWLRTVEHRLQMWRERRVHRLPRDPGERMRLARVLGFRDNPQASAVERFESTHHAVLTDVRARFERVFYRPMIETLADPAAGRLSPAALRQRLGLLGFRDVERAARTLDGLVSGTSRRAKLLRVLTPAMLRFLASSPLPDEGLLGFLRLGEALGERLDVLGGLRDNPPALALLARVLGSGRLLGEILAQAPEELSLITADAGTARKDRERLVHEARLSLRWREPAARSAGLRRFKRREMLRIALADLAGSLGPDEVGAALADVADACLEAALEGGDVALAVVALGKLGARELNYASDIDVMFVCEGDVAAAERVAADLMRAIGEVTPEGQAFRIDAALRPEGRAGPLVRSFDALRGYYERWARPWERLAVTKARFAAGDAGLGERVRELAERVAYEVPVTSEELMEIRHLKARMERERIPRGTEARRHLKLGPGGLSDIEFAAQLLQLRHGLDHPPLRVTGTTEALAAARSLGLLEEEAATRLCDTYRFLTTLRNRLYMLFGRPVDVLPNRPEDLEALGKAMGFTESPRQQLEEAYLRATRRSRRVTEPLIYG